MDDIAVKPPKPGSKTELVLNELLKNDGRSQSQIARDLGVDSTVVSDVKRKYITKAYSQNPEQIEKMKLIWQSPLYQLKFRRGIMRAATERNLKMEQRLKVESKNSSIANSLWSTFQIKKEINESNLQRLELEVANLEKSE